MTEHPILFSAPMVRAILEGRKTQTRRVVKGFEQADGFRQTLDSDKSIWLGKGGGQIKCPYGQPGDRLWVRETMESDGDDYWFPKTEANLWPNGIEFPFPVENGDYAPVVLAWMKKQSEAGRTTVPAIYMPRWASRINCEITDVRVQRLQDISEEDAKAEGAECLCSIEDAKADERARENGNMEEGYFSPKSYVDGFQRLWDSINAARGYGWDSNPWVWAVSFRRVQ